MIIIQLIERYTGGGTERVMEMLSAELGKSNTVINWIVHHEENHKGNFIYGYELDPSISPDVIILHCGLLQYQDYSYLHLEQYNVPIICVLHRLEKVVHVKGVHYVAVSKAVQEMQSFQCEVINNPVVFVGSTCKKTGTAKQLVVGRHCRFSMEKNWGDFIYIATKVVMRLPEIKIRVLGRLPGIIDNVLTDWSKKIDVDLLDWSDEVEDIKSFLCECDIYLETSLNESFGLSAAEAAALSVPVVCLKSKATEEIFGDLTSDNRECAIDRIVLLLEDSKYRNEYARRCRNKVSIFSSSSICDKYDSFIRKCISEHNKNGY